LALNLLTINDLSFYISKNLGYILVSTAQKKHAGICVL